MLPPASELASSATRCWRIGDGPARTHDADVDQKTTLERIQPRGLRALIGHIAPGGRIMADSSSAAPNA